MTQKKWITYGLGLLVIGVWGIILQRIFSATDPGTEKSTSGQFSLETRKAKVPVLQPDTFSLQLDYGNPFDTGNGAGRDVKPGITDRIEVPVLAAPPKPVAIDPLDQVVYLGHILNPATKKRVAILSIAGKEYMVQEGDSSGKFKLWTVAAGEIRIGHGRKIKRITSKL